MPPVISVENLSKSYTLGTIGTGTFSYDLAVWWARVRGKPNPLLRIGETDHGNRVGEEIWALKDVSFQVQQGEVLGVIGRNGAGKSTLLKILSRVTAPTSGEVKVKGRIASLLEVGTGFHPELTGRENIYLNGAILGMTKEEVTRKFDEIVDFSGVEKFIDTPVKRYSSGMYVRLAFAVAAHLESEILLVDEVLAVGDAEFQKKCLGKMGDVAHNEGRTVLFVSHNMAAVRQLTEKSLLLLSGLLKSYDLTEVITSQYERALHEKEQNNSALIECSNMDHSGSGEARIVKAKIANSADEPTTTFFMNEPIKIDFEIDNPNLIKLNYSLEITDQHDYPLFHFQSEYEDTRNIHNNFSKRQIITINIPALNLYPDQYFINLWIGVHHSRVDKVTKAFKFKMEQPGTLNRSMLTTRGRVLREAEWLINENYEVKE